MRRCQPVFWFRRQIFQSTHFIRSATLQRLSAVLKKHISIHALHTKCDWISWLESRPLQNFNPRTSYEVRRIRTTNSTNVRLISIHALHTKCDVQTFENQLPCDYFNPRTSYEVRHAAMIAVEAKRDISIHALHTKCDQRGLARSARLLRFQSTHFIRSATSLL